MSTHLINGEWTQNDSGEFFQAFAPEKDAPLERKFAEGGAAEVDAAAQAAQAAFKTFAALDDAARAKFLRAIAEQIEARGDDLTAAAQQETALPPARLAGERGRTVGQLKMFADFVEQGRHLDAHCDPALPTREPLPRPDLRLAQQPLGPVAVFGASNFPLAFSAAGGDTAAALAAGCPVIVKGHPAHPHTGQIVAEAVAKAAAAQQMPAGVFSLIQGSTPALSLALVEHPAVCAVGFTGSLRAGRALFDAACRRAAPIPFYAEMGSINPVFLLPDAAAEKLAEVAQGWAQSLTLGGGQFCTNPGVLFCPAAAADEMARQTIAALEQNAAHTMLTPGIAAAYNRALESADKFIQWRGDGGKTKCAAAAALLRCTVDEWLENSALQDEMFGPAGVMAVYDDPLQLPAAIGALAGQLTATLWLTEKDHESARALLPALEQKAGRLICNGFPTGVEVADAMMHGGPYPAATLPATSVGSMAIRRFLRPVCRQSFPADLLPPVLRALS